VYKCSFIFIISVFNKKGSRLIRMVCWIYVSHHLDT